VNEIVREIDGVIENVGVTDAVPEIVGVGLLVSETVFVNVREGVGVAVGVLVILDVGVILNVTEGVGVKVLVGDGVRVGLRD